MRLYDDIAIVAKKCGARKVVLFGSRARGDNRSNSDIDVAVYGMPESQRGIFATELEKIPTLLKIDIVHVSEAMNEKFLQNIECDGVLLMGRFFDKYEKYLQAVERLNEAVQDYEKTPIESIKDGVIQRFEFTTELAWKTLREYLIDQGYVELNSPKSVLNQSFVIGLFSDERVWLNIINDRNMTSHIYDEKTADEIFQRIKKQYVEEFENLKSKLGQKK